MPGTVIRDVALWWCFTWLLSLPTWGRCGRASLPPAPSFGQQPLTREQVLLPGAVLSHNYSGW
jgi:hypothetical protein